MNNSKQIEIKVFSSEYKEDVIDLIVGIQQKEFGIAVTAEEQPDLNNILRVRAKISLHFRRTDLGQLCSIRDCKTAGIASYFEDFGVEDRAKMA